MSLVQFLFSFEGRARRLHVWIFFLVLSLVYGGLFWQFGNFHVVRDYTTQDSYYGPAFVLAAIEHNAFVWPVYLVSIWMKLAVLTKRWHDRGKSGWWNLVGLIPVIGGLWVLIECGFLDGTRGSNKYGPSPKAVGAPAGAF